MELEFPKIQNGHNDPKENENCTMMAYGETFYGHQHLTPAAVKSNKIYKGQKQRMCKRKKKKKNFYYQGHLLLTFYFVLRMLDQL